MEEKEKKAVRNMTIELGNIYPVEFHYNSRASLWNLGLEEGLVTRDLYNTAEKYYGNLWHYVGD